MTTSPGDTQVRARLFGTVRLWRGDEELGSSTLTRRTGRSLFLLLLTTPGHRLSRERIISLLWPELSPAAARNALSKSLHALRRVLEPDLTTGQASAFLASDLGEIGIRPEQPLIVDVDRFESLLATAARRSEAERIPLLREALALYTGDLLASELYVDWPVRRRETLRLTRQRATIELGRLALAAGVPAAAQDALEALTGAEPANEAAQLLLMRVNVARGQPERALEAFAHCRDALREELDAEPGSEIAEFAASLRGTMVTPAAAPLPPLVLPPVPTPPTPLAGRDRELDLLHDLLRQPEVRLITLTGPAGVGKTRLAKELAQTTDAFPDGVAFLPLADIQTPALVLPAIARAFGALANEPRDYLAAIRHAMSDRRVLLVVDNFEQLLPATDDLTALLTCCPRLVLLVTSRIPLRVQGEHLLAIETLPVPPDTDELTYRSLRRYPAAELFVARLMAVRPDFRPSDEIAPIIGAICRRLDGLPLALELAAARGRQLPLPALQARLSHRLDLLTGGPRDLPDHQRTLRSTLTWSYDALAAAEQTLFRRLAVFAGGFQMDGAVWLMRDNPAAPHAATVDDYRTTVEQALRALVEANLLRIEETNADEPHYGLLETMRAYGLELLAKLGELETTRVAHAAYVVALVERLQTEPLEPVPEDRFDRLVLEDDNLRAALDWLTATGENETALRLALAIRRYWEIQGGAVEGAYWLDLILDRMPDQVNAIRAKACYAAGLLAEHLGELDRATTRLEEAARIWHRLGDQQGIGLALNFLGQVAMARGDMHRARAIQETTLAILRATGDERDLAIALAGLANAEIFLHDFPAANAHYDEAITLFRALDDTSRLNTALSNRGVLATWQGDLDLTSTYLAESLALSRQLDYRRGIADALANSSVVHALRGDLAQAERLVTDAMQLYQEIGDQRCKALTLAMLADLVHRQGDDDAAIAHLRQAAGFFRQVKDQASLLECIELAARIKPLCPDPWHSTRLLAAAAAVREAAAVPREPPNQAEYDRWLAELHATLTADAFNAAWEAGRAISLDEAVAMLLPAPHSPDELVEAIAATASLAGPAGLQSRAG